MDDKMDIEELKQRKRETENWILQILTDFEKETSLIVEDVNLLRERYIDNSTLLHTVKIDIRLDL